VLILPNCGHYKTTAKADIELVIQRAFFMPFSIVLSFSAILVSFAHKKANYLEVYEYRKHKNRL
jgi:hypothetical protein